MLYTSFYDSEKLDKAIDDGRYVVSISRSEPRWLEVDQKVWELAPTKELFRNTKLSDALWEKEYHRQLDSKKEIILQILKDLDKKDAILCCWCEDYESCHRRFLSNWAKKHKIKVEEL